MCIRDRLAGGVLTGKYRHTTPPDSRAASAHLRSSVEPYLESSLPIVEALSQAAHGLECSIADVALAWVEGTPGVTSAIIGPRNLVQLEQILNGRIDLPLPNTGYVAGTELQSAVRPDGALKVEPTLQVVGQTNIYAIGDVTDVRESKRADAARAQARIVISNISSQLSGKEPQATYNPSDEWVILPLGPEHGVSQLIDSQGNSRILGPDQTAEIKGADLMVSVIRSQLNLP